MLIGLHAPFSATRLSNQSSTLLRTATETANQTSVLSNVLSATLVGHRIAATNQGHHVLFSGHIQNRKSLRQSLGDDLQSDTDLYAAAYAKWGDDADLRICGSYSSIILYDNATKIRLAASPISCAPLHYIHDGAQFLAASRVQALFASGRTERVLDERKVADSLFLNYQDPEHGWFERIKQIASGTRVFVTAEGVKIDRYYDLKDLPDVQLLKDSDYVDAADALFREGTHLILDGFHHPAVSLSGGYDSQAVAAYAMLARPKNSLRSYTSVPEEGWDGKISTTRFGDERPYVDALSAAYPQLAPNWVVAEGRSFDHFQREMFEFSLQTQRNAMNLHWIHDAFRQAKTDGCDVMLMGAMGNATFSYSGEQALSSWLAKGKILPLLEELFSGGPLASVPRRFIGKALMPLLPRKIWEGIMRLRHGKELDPFESWCPMNRDYAEQMGVMARAKSVGFDPLFRPPANSRKLRAKMLTMAGGADTRLAMEMIHGIPTRDPTSYRPLVEYCLGIPDDQYLKNGVRRWLAKRMLNGKVPDAVLNETRKGQQAADWHLRLSRQREDLIAEIDWLMEDPAMVHRLNLTALRQALVDFPKTTPTDQATSARLQLAVARGLTTARFIRYLDGRNS